MKDNNYRDIIAKILIDIESVKFSFENPLLLLQDKKVLFTLTVEKLFHS